MIISWPTTILDIFWNTSHNHKNVRNFFVFFHTFLNEKLYEINEKMRRRSNLTANIVMIIGRHNRTKVWNSLHNFMVFYWNSAQKYRRCWLQGMLEGDCFAGNEKRNQAKWGVFHIWAKKKREYYPTTDFFFQIGKYHKCHSSSFLTHIKNNPKLRRRRRDTCYHAEYIFF